MNILVTGNLGYIGSVLVQELKQKSYFVIGLDCDFFDGCELESFVRADQQIYKDIRDISLSNIQGTDAIIHLAALSNDPLGELNPLLTEEINFTATIRLGQLAKQAGVRRFVYVSSQSMYGISDSDIELDEDTSEKNPLTAYAKTKWDAECKLKNMAADDFIVTCFRPSTVFGVSPKLRCDIVFNNLVACAYTTGKIEIKSNGTPWRPVVHVRDVCKALIAGLESPEALIKDRSFNVGIQNGNYTIRDLAEAAQSVVPGSSLVFTGEHPDSRTYRVSFDNILCILKDYYKPEWDLIRGGRELVSFFKRVGFTEDHFRGRKCNRLLQLKYLIHHGIIDKKLRKGNK